DLPILPDVIPTKVIPKTRKQYQTVKKYLNAADTESLICATDAGREGELIFRLIYEEAKCKKPVQRLWISSMTDAAIREGFEA
ncbi:MAG: DNA topoisomerase III, partial [Clostridia bacterium]|nr:DNA topoisomerase III [Clostridia bacterium]